jgi:hypothetical protein
VSQLSTVTGPLQQPLDLLYLHDDVPRQTCRSEANGVRKINAMEFDVDLGLLLWKCNQEGGKKRWQWQGRFDNGKAVRLVVVFAEDKGPAGKYPRLELGRSQRAKQGSAC